jgi:hypothetical protein
MEVKVMIELLQYKVNEHELTNQYAKLGEIQLSLNRELIEKDIARLRNEMAISKNKYNIANIKSLIAYLQKLLKNVNDESIFEICWDTDKLKLPYTYPLNLINEPLYNINICNYIELCNNEKLVELDLTDLADIIAIEFMFKDLGETHDTVEDALKECSIVGFTESTVLTDRFKENNDKMYELSKTMRIGETPYMSLDTKKVHDYFYSTEIKTKDYKEVVEYSCRYATTLIANDILKNSIHSSIDIKLIMLNATEIAFIVNAGNEVDIKGKLINNISIRTFGRKFLIEPKISVF